MIVRFALSNYLTFDYREKPIECINMIPSKYKNKPDHIIDDVDLLKSSVFFGTNGVGKTNIIKGLECLKHLVLSRDTPSFVDDYCKFNKNNKNKPIRMEIEFIKRSPRWDVFSFFDLYYNNGYDGGISYKNSDNMKEWHNIFKKEYCSIKHYRYCIEIMPNDIKNPILYESISHIINGKESVIYKLGDRIDEFYDSKEPGEDCPNNMDIKTFQDSRQKLSKELDKYNHLKKELIEKINLCNYEKGAYAGESYAKDKIGAIDTQKKILETELKMVNAKLEDTLEKIKKSNNFVHNCENKDKNLKKKRNMIFSQVPLELLKKHSGGYSSYNEWAIISAMRDVYVWFKDTLSIIDVGDAVIPRNGYLDLEKINSLLSKFDTRIPSLEFEPVEDYASLLNICLKTRDHEIDRLVRYSKSSLFLSNNYLKIVRSGEDIYEMSFKDHSLMMKRLITRHKDGTKHELIEESDGTRRLIDLIHPLVDSPGDKVYIIDELDRRLHPLITKTYVELFFRPNLKNTQLLFTTHESRLVTTDLFRLDEIKFVNHDENRSTTVSRADSTIKDYSSRLDEMYLKNMLGGTPDIKD